MAAPTFNKTPSELMLPEGVSINDYDHYIIAFSGGKDSLACLMFLLDMGVDRDKIELWHHCIDGDPGHGMHFMDWECTVAYCRAVSIHFGVRLYLSWRDGGFLKEATRQDSPTAPVYFEEEDWSLKFTGGKGKPNTRMKFPQISANLSVRWCSASLKIDVADCALRNQPRFNGKRTLFVTGERAEESSARANYKVFEPHRTHVMGPKVQRHVDHLRPVHSWAEATVWAMIESHSLMVHPAYYLGWSRCSCKTCIFLNKDGFASANKISPERVDDMSTLEEIFGYTMKRDVTIKEMASRGVPYKALNNPKNAPMVAQAIDSDWWMDLTMSEWRLPSGAYGDASCGPS